MVFLLQFTSVVNCFYLVNAILQSTPSISVANPLVTIIPLSFVFLMGMVKEFLVEFKRWKSDRAMNKTPCRRVKAITNGEFEIETTDVSRVRVGDILSLKEGENIPGDAIVLQVRSKSDSTVTPTQTHDNGECFVQTDALDGERNLKAKLALK